MTKADIIKHGLDCPDCDNSGMKVGGNESTGSEPEQCEWCHCYPGSKFQLSSDLDELLRETAVNFELSSYQFPDGYEDDVNERYDKWSTPNTGDKK